MDSDDDRARYWGVLNRFRRIAEDIYQTHVSLAGSAGSDRAFAIGVFAVGVVWTVGLAVYGVAASVGRDSAIGFGAAEAIGLLVLVIGIWLLVAWRRRVRRRAPYAARGREREEWRTVALAALAEKWGARVESGRAASSYRAAAGGRAGVESADVSPACRFLIEHWPDQAPELVLFHQGDEEERWTLAGECEGRPVLLQVLDSARSIRDLSPPVLAVLVASPLALAGVATRPEETAPGRALAAEGFVVGWTGAGAWAIHRGPAGALLNAPDLERVASTVAKLCGEAPEATALRRAVDPVADDAGAQTSGPARPDLADAEHAIEAFLTALRDHDDLGALARTDPLIFGGPMEPSPADLGGLVTAKRLRPVSWRRKGDRSVVNDTACECAFNAQFADRDESQLSVYVTRRLGWWLVRGVKDNNELLVGFDFNALSV
jgi:hypothetical protein